MKISAIEIRKHTFEKIFRGYDPDEVDAFLNSLSQEWERFASENNLLKMQLEYAEKELSKLKDIESTLFRTLKAAEDTSKLIEKEAHENAEKRIEESRTQANELVAEAEARTNQVIRETDEKLKQFREEFASEIKRQERDFKAIENFRDNLVVQLTSLANNTIDTVERFEQKYDKDSVLNKMEEIKKHVSEIEIPKKATYAAPVSETETETNAEVQEEPEAAVVLTDDRPEVVFEITDQEEPEVEAEFVQPEPEPEPETVFEPEPEPEIEASVPEEPEPVEEEVYPNVRRNTNRSAADEAIEALAALQLQKAAEKAREAAPAQVVNRPKETVQPKKTGGGSFFDQI